VSGSPAGQRLVRVGDLGEDLALDHEFDAVVGRTVLIHLSEPGAVLRRLLKPSLSRRAGCLPGVSGAGQLSSSIRLRPYSSRSRTGAGRRAPKRIEPLDRDLSLYRPSSKLGCRHPGCAPTPTSSADAGAYFDLFVSTIRTALPRILEFGIATAEEVDIERLPIGYAPISPPSKRWESAIMVDAWARKP